MGQLSLVRQFAVTRTLGCTQGNPSTRNMQRFASITMISLLAPLALPMPQPQNVGSLQEVTFVGELGDTDHDVGGKVHILNEDTLVIDEFSYDNKGFGVYINVATRGSNLGDWQSNRINVPYPSGSEGEPIQTKYSGEGQLLIDLSQVNVKARDVKWLSVWCTVFNLSFGHVEFFRTCQILV